VELLRDGAPSRREGRTDYPKLYKRKWKCKTRVFVLQFTNRQVITGVERIERLAAGNSAYGNGAGSWEGLQGTAALVGVFSQSFLDATQRARARPPVHNAQLVEMVHTCLPRFRADGVTVPRPRQHPKAVSRRAAKPPAAAASKPQAVEFRCAECGRVFDRAAALGAHRRAHGIVGASRSARAGNGTMSRLTRSARGRESGAEIDRDALLRGLFPRGIPPRQHILRAVNAWLDEANRLARLR
jgi:hypothetical protein